MLRSLLLGEVGVLVGVQVEVIELSRLTAVHIVPPVTCELMLVEEGAVGAKERSALMAVSPVIANVVCLASSFDISVHPGGIGDIAAVEVGRRDALEERVVDSRRPRHFA